MENSPPAWFHPDSKTEEGEAFAFSELKGENKKLRDAIQARTIDLEQKNRELEIETAVERVRAEAMAMHSTEDFGKVSRQLLQQIRNLSLKGFTGASIYLIDENEFITCYDFSSFGNMGDAIFSEQNASSPVTGFSHKPLP